MAAFTGHGGDLDYATNVFGQPDGGWQDLSTGISPWPYPAPPVPDSVWQRLPDDGTDLCKVAAMYYGVAPERILPLPGSQQAIARLPHLLPPARVALPAVGYGEYQRAWQSAGHSLMFYRDLQDLLVMVADGLVAHAVVIHPNNPTGEMLDTETLWSLCTALSGVGLVVVDEAFADVQPLASRVNLLVDLPNLLVLRSMGKFFGMAGLRLGFLLGDKSLACVQQLADELTPWGISHPAQWLGRLALQDREWQLLQRARIQHAAEKLLAIWRRHIDSNIALVSRGLFITLRGDRERLLGIYHALGSAGIYTRWCHWPPETCAQAWLRCGLPDDDGARLNAALAGYFSATD